ncbi:MULTISPECIES: hypothetical protein [Providencia]|uniref:hypothetical protein n=1 Tax=Providencia TaxID=586 RepID=UPI001CFD195E|nr:MULTISPECIES: hypothetical protein [Providencia]EIU7559083.1 hypothetical protein [Providencia rettgeri]ELR5152593.1 hypothetical protein [Providencia rettgeri]MCB4843021.1 hypothetical protein [Providencia rettgeri]MCG5276055.1 hypothetical protein [Providencia rettgeri]MCG9508210.1 hypothetical protein [Providencia rettgeri]
MPNKRHSYTVIASLMVLIACGAASFIAPAQSFNSGLFSQETLPESSSNDTCEIQTTDVLYPYTQLKASQFHQTEMTELPPISQTVQVVCSAPVASLLIHVDSDVQAASTIGHDPTHFGLGFVNGQGRLGHYRVKLTDARVNGQQTQLYQTNDLSQVGRAQPESWLQSSVYQGWSRDGLSPVSGERYSVTMTVQPYLNSLKETNGPLVSGADLNGELVLSFPFSI